MGAAAARAGGAASLIVDLLLQAFGRRKAQPVEYGWFRESQVAGPDMARDAEDPARVDDSTWRDLEVPRLLEQWGTRASILAQQHFYKRLRRGGPVDASLRKAADEMEVQRTAALLAQTQSIRDKLRCQDVDLSPSLYLNALPTVPLFTRHLWIEPALLILGLAAAMLANSWWLALGTVFAHIVVFVVTQLQLSPAIDTFKSQRLGTMNMLEAARQFAGAGGQHPHPLLEPSLQLAAQTRRLQSALALNWIERIPQLAEYCNLVVLYECIGIRRKIAAFRALVPVLRQVYEVVAECEAALCLLEHLRDPGRGDICWAHDDGRRTLRLLGMYNPLLKGADPLSLDVDGSGAFITGQNGIGKSTLLRAVGLNVLVARAFGFCYAKGAVLPRVPVWSSIQNEDSLARGESLYMAELHRAEKLLKVARQSQGAIFIVDEIFRGTNNLESVAAATAVIHRLAEGSLAIVSSHNLVLAPLLRAQLLPFRIVRDGFLRLEPGVLAETNGIRLMDDYDFDERLRTDARRVFDWFSKYVMQPADFPELC